MTENGGGPDRPVGGPEDSGEAANSWFQPSSERYRRQAEYRDPYEDRQDDGEPPKQEESREYHSLSSGPSYPNTRGYPGFGGYGDAPGMAEPYPAALSDLGGSTTGPSAGGYPFDLPPRDTSAPSGTEPAHDAPSGPWTGPAAESDEGSPGAAYDLSSSSYRPEELYAPNPQAPTSPGESDPPARTGLSFAQGATYRLDLPESTEPGSSTADQSWDSGEDATAKTRSTWSHDWPGEHSAPSATEEAHPGGPTADWPDPPSMGLDTGVADISAGEPAADPGGEQGQPDEDTGVPFDRNPMDPPHHSSGVPGGEWAGWNDPTSGTDPLDGGDSSVPDHVPADLGPADSGRQTYADSALDGSLGSGSGNTWAFSRDDPSLPDSIREIVERASAPRFDTDDSLSTPVEGESSWRSEGGSSSAVGEESSWRDDGWSSAAVGEESSWRSEGDLSAPMEGESSWRDDGWSSAAVDGESSWRSEGDLSAPMEGESSWRPEAEPFQETDDGEADRWDRTAGDPEPAKHTGTPPSDDPLLAIANEQARARARELASQNDVDNWNLEEGIVKENTGAVPLPGLGQDGPEPHDEPEYGAPSEWDTGAHYDELGYDARAERYGPPDADHADELGYDGRFAAEPARGLPEHDDEPERAAGFGFSDGLGYPDQPTREHDQHDPWDGGAVRPVEDGWRASGASLAPHDDVDQTEDGGAGAARRLAEPEEDYYEDDVDDRYYPEPLPEGRSRTRKRDKIAEEFPGFTEPLGGDPSADYPGYDNIDVWPETHRLALVTAWLGVASLLPGIGLVTAVAALVLGSRARREIQESRGQLEGAGMAGAGMVLAGVGVVVSVLAAVVFLL